MKCVIFFFFCSVFSQLLSVPTAYPLCATGEKLWTLPRPLCDQSHSSRSYSVFVTVKRLINAIVRSERVPSALYCTYTLDLSCGLELRLRNAESVLLYLNYF